MPRRSLASVSYHILELKLRDRNAEFVRLDLKLPKVDGREELHTIRSDGRTRRPPIAMIAPPQEQRDRIIACNPAVGSIVAKPAASEKVSAAVVRRGLRWLKFNQFSI